MMVNIIITLVSLIIFVVILRNIIINKLEKALQTNDKDDNSGSDVKNMKIILRLAEYVSYVIVLGLSYYASFSWPAYKMILLAIFCIHWVTMFIFIGISFGLGFLFMEKYCK